MKRIYLQYVLLACLGFSWSACHQQNPTSELEKAAAALAKTEAAPATTDSDSNSTSSGPPPAQQVREALADYKEGKMEDAVTRLQILRASPVLSPQQRMALQDSVAAVMAEIYALAEKGDPRAIAAVAQYEKMQTHR
jgi:hypothetical protein